MTTTIKVGSRQLRVDVDQAWFRVHIPEYMKQPKILKKYRCTFYIWFPKKMRPLYKSNNDYMGTAAILGIIDTEENYLSLPFYYKLNRGRNWERVKYILQGYHPGNQPCHDLRDVAKTVRIEIDWIIDKYQDSFSRAKARQRGEGPRAPGGN